MALPKREPGTEPSMPPPPPAPLSLLEKLDNLDKTLSLYGPVFFNLFQYAVFGSFMLIFVIMAVSSLVFFVGTAVYFLFEGLKGVIG